MQELGTASQQVRHGLVVRIAGSHPAGPGSIPGGGIKHFGLAHNFLHQRQQGPTSLGDAHSITRPCHTLPGQKVQKGCDEDGIRTHACRAHWISSPTP